MSSIEKSVASLTLHGKDLDLQEITELLHCTPSKAHHKGQLISSVRKNYATKGMWSLDSNLADDVELEIKIKDILDKVNNDVEVWQSLNARFSTRVFCGIFMDFSNEGFGLSPQLLYRLASLGLLIDFDIYAPISED